MKPALLSIVNSGWKAGPAAAGRSFGAPTALAEVERFHRSIPHYAPTPLRRLSRLAAHWGVSEVFVKDESPRFGLNAFKVLGAGYAMGKVLARRLGKSLDELPFDQLVAQSATRLKGLIFAATTDGNHGRGVAWTATQLGLPATIYMPVGTASARLENIRKLGQKAEVTTWNYDDTVRWVAGQAAAQNWEVIQDTSWEGYTEVPEWIMQGYSTVAREAIEQLGPVVPTHIFLQAGVGAFAAVLAQLLLQQYESHSPKIVLLEAQPAECFYRSFVAGKKVAAGGDLTTIMAGLACGEPNPLSWDILKDCCFASVAAPDETAAFGMRVLANPLPGDDRVISGESGAIGTGVLGWVTQKPEYAELKASLGLGPDSRVLCFSTEGDTDPVMYRRVVWEGAYHE